MSRACGECTMCCRLPGVVELSKPAGEWCKHCAIGKGCTIYEERPSSCKFFECLWLTDERMPEDLRPDKSKVIFYPPAEQPYPDKVVDLIVMEDPKQSGRWQSGAVGRLVNSFRHQGLTLCVVSGDRNEVLPPL